jgi:hypothetical protein
MLKKPIFILRQISLLIAVTRGLFKPGLVATVRGVVVGHLGSNLEFRANRYPPLVRAMRWAVGNPFLALFLIACPYLGVMLSTQCDWVDSFALAEERNASARDFWTVNVGLFSVQAALVGVVFPLVIAFVGLLNQGRASFASRLTIYIDSSGALFVGVSSLLLCVMIAGQLPFAGNFANVSAAVTLVNIAWFAINALALGYFVMRTIAFLHPAQRAPIMRTYAANVIWPRELSAAVTANRWANVIGYGHLPTGDEADPFAAGARARIWYSGIWEGGEVSVNRCLRRKMRLMDVRFGVLEPVVNLWLKHARELDCEQVQDFVVPLQPGWNYEGNQALVRATLPLGLVARGAVRVAFQFRRAPAENGVIKNTSKVLSEMIADLLVLIDGRQVNEFRDQIDDIVEFHAFLYRLAQNSDDGHNYAQIESGQELFANTLGEEWVHTYYDLIRRVVESLSDEPELIRPMAYVPFRVYTRVSSEVTPQALRPLITMAEILTDQMTDWATGEHRAQAASVVGDRPAFSLSVGGEAYARAWREQVAGWERLLHVMTAPRDRRERENESWEDLQSVSDNIDAHLRATTRMAARAVWYGDTLATSWTSDLLLHWKGQLEGALLTRRGHTRVQAEALTIQTLQRDWDLVQSLPLFPGGATSSAPAVFNEIMKNTWSDYVLVLVSVCVHWVMRDRASETATQAAHMLLQGEDYDRGGTGARERRGLTGADILLSALRITGSGEHFSEGSYAAHIDRLLETLSSFGQSPMVSMRIYTSAGGLSFSDLSQAQAITLMATTSGAQSINVDLRRLLTQSEDESLRRREAYLNSLVSAFDHLNADRHLDSLEALVGPTGETSFDVRLAHARQLVEQSLEVLAGFRSQAILEAQIDDARIEAVASAAASEAFSGNEFPCNLFDQLTLTTETLSPFTMRVSGLNKGEFTYPPMKQTVLNEEEWWREAMSEQVGAVVWSDILRSTRFLEVEGQTPDEFWRAIREGSARMRDDGHDPLLVIGNASNPDWMFDWQWPEGRNGTSRPADLVITREEDQVSSYDFTMNDTPVYRAQSESGVAYLIPSQLLCRLCFHDYDDGLPLSLSFEPDAEDAWLGTMHLTFERHVELATNMTAYRIRWAQAPETPVSSDD